MLRWSRGCELSFRVLSLGVCQNFRCSALCPRLRPRAESCLRVMASGGTRTNADRSSDQCGRPHSSAPRRTLSTGRRGAPPEPPRTPRCREALGLAGGPFAATSPGSRLLTPPNLHTRLSSDVSPPSVTRRPAASAPRRWARAAGGPSLPCLSVRPRLPLRSSLSLGGVGDSKTVPMHAGPSRPGRSVCDPVPLALAATGARSPGLASPLLHASPNPLCAFAPGDRASQTPFSAHVSPACSLTLQSSQLVLTPTPGPALPGAAATVLAKPVRPAPG